MVSYGIDYHWSYEWLFVFAQSLYYYIWRTGADVMFKTSRGNKACRIVNTWHDVDIQNIMSRIIIIK